MSQELEELFTSEQLEKMGMKKKPAIVEDVVYESDVELLEAKKQELTKYENFKIENEEGFLTASALLVKCKDSIKEISKRLAVALEPFKQKKRELDEQIKKTKEPYEVVSAGLEAMKDKMDELVLGYHKKISEEIAKKQLLADQKFEKDQEKAEKKAEKLGVQVQAPVATVYKKPDTFKATGLQIKTLQTYSIPGFILNGTPMPNAVLTRSNEKLHVIPDQYWILDTKALGQAHKAKGCIIPGTIHSEKKITAR